jgi:hypothetical protein
MQDDAVDIVLRRILAVVGALHRLAMGVLRTGIRIDQPLRAAPGDGLGLGRGRRQGEQPRHRDVAALV